ncbi:diacylglycerol kinase family lipid kinase [Siccirubricoccus sp. KC 17139]|uniref:Diacylglycerol kinase family lipid kinase n=1 Tax=Siccirubricoccus soli TaxID=2899147 RepID=A0ABT1DBM1_9PROT|nr:diacylglycerol kinase family protein [Siccirubricoccus soli]MCO6419341.1 diacylglycerol kinase family lipid kinase [Siccirubricoccus soli]MCP2685476.1 diacylglycerol kinase family lipid kinase [Siccirubricoccus soli]
MLIVFNPTAGRRRHRRLAQALATLRAKGLRPELAETERPGHAIALAREAAWRGCPLVVAAGGDGTIAEVAAGLAGSSAGLGILPLGTANVLAWELGVPLAPEAAATVLAEGAPRWLRPGVARFGDGRMRLFVQMLGAGFDAAVVHRLDLRWKRALGRGAYVLQGMRELGRYPFPRFTAALDGGPAQEVTSAIVTKGRLYAGRHLLAPAARPGEPGFQVALFPRGGALAAALYGAALPLDLLPRLPGVVLLPARRVVLHGEEVPVQADGDAVGRLPVVVEEAASPIRMVLPRG